ncbi:hypothetical protein CY35_16G022700 [Sphagnum magellanicum]|nr:hypothetical protein CY35_16G022700 [Sphagnum magellanicum]KAH9536880.1 hypothetical protein CY35_16G022700 [Sphagnum magellanicum]
MASSCIRQVASCPLKSRALAVPSKLKITGLNSSTSFLGKPLLRQSFEHLQVSSSQVAKSRKPVAGHKGLSVAAQSVTTAPETEAEAQASTEESFSETTEDAVPAVLTPKKVTPRVKDIMKILNSEALLAATKDITLPDIRPGDVVQIRFEVPENKRRVSLLRGIVISRRNAGINTTFRIRRVMAGVGVEIVFPLYSPNIKEMKVLSKRKVRRAKLFYLRDKIARLSSC